jgi:tetratricopeptide (TPR) repeat protein
VADWARRGALIIARAAKLVAVRRHIAALQAVREGVAATRAAADAGATGAARLLRALIAVETMAAASADDAALDRLPVSAALTAPWGDEEGNADPPDAIAAVRATLPKLLRWTEQAWADERRVQRLKIAAAEGADGELALGVALGACGRGMAFAGRMGEARAFCREASLRLRRLVDAGSHHALSYLGEALKSLGATQAQLGDAAAGLAATEEACGIFAALARSERWTFLAPHSSTLHNLAIVRGLSGDLSGAVEAAERAIDLRHELARVSPDAFRMDLADTLIQAGGLAAQAGLAGEAVDWASEGAAIFRELAHDEPVAFAPALATALRVLSHAALLNRDSELGLATVDEEVATRTTLADAQDVQAIGLSAEAVHNRATFQAMRGDDRLALESARVAAAAFLRLGPSSFARQAGAAAQLAGTLAERLELAEATDWFEQAVAVREALCVGESPDARRDLAQSCIELSRHYARVGDLSGAVKHTSKADGALAFLAQQAGGDDIRASARVRLQLGNLLRKAGRTEEAIGAYEASAKLREALRCAQMNEDVAIVAGLKLVTCLKRAGRTLEADAWARRLADSGDAG